MFMSIEVDDSARVASVNLKGFALPLNVKIRALN